MNKTCFITGISGMDGFNLTKHMLSNGYSVKGICRRHSVSENQKYRLESLNGDIEVIYGDVLDKSSIDNALKKFNPEKIFHLAAQSHVGISSELKNFTTQVNYLGTLNVLESIREYCPHSKTYFAASSEMFGSSCDIDTYQRETTHMTPVSPYGITKLAGMHLSNHFKNAYNMFIGVGILFNHTHQMRGANFICSKLARAAAQVKMKLVDKIECGNLDSSRDFGNSQDYVVAMNMILDHYEADTFVISSGETYTIRELADFCFKYVGLNYKDHLVLNAKFLRAQELPYLRGDSSKARNILGWKPEYTFEKTFSEIMDYWLNYYMKK